MERTEQLLTTIDRLGAAKIKHLQRIHDLKSYRNACLVVRKLMPYTHQFYHDKAKVIYLNKEGRQLIGSTKEVKKSPLIAHTLLRNEAFIHFGCPLDWRTEHPLTKQETALSGFQIKVEGLSLKQEKKVIADAVFSRNGYLYIIEIDHTRNMADNRKKIELYREILPSLENPLLYLFTGSDDRKRKLAAWMKGMRGEVKTFVEI